MKQYTYSLNEIQITGSNALLIKKEDEFVWKDNVIEASSQITIPTKKSIFANQNPKLTQDNSCDICCSSSLMGT